MDSLELNKIIAGVLGAVLTLMLFTWVGDIVYGFYGSKDHGDEHHLAYEIELPEGETEMAEEEAPEPIGVFLASADPASGESLFRACSACHNAAEATNKVGPHLVGVMGRDIAGLGDFGYSAALSGIDGVWTAEAFSGFIENPRGWAPGTAMGYNGMRDPEDRADIIAYLVQASGQNLQDFIVLPEATEEAPAEEAPAEEAVTEEAPAEEAPAEETEAAPAEEATEAEATETEASEAETVTADELPSGAEGGVSAADPNTGPSTDAGQEDVIITEEPVQTAPSRAPEAEDANNLTPAQSEAIAEENTAPAAEEVAPTEAPVEEVPAEETPSEEAPAEAAAPVEEEAAAPAEAETTTAASADVPAFMANADATAGEAAFRACRACHVVEEGVNRTGPSLHGIVGRDIGSVDGFNYSSAIAEKEGEWTYENLNAFLEAPRTWLPGTRMGYAGMRSEQDRANVIAYMEAASQ